MSQENKKSIHMLANASSTSSSKALKGIIAGKFLKVKLHENINIVSFGKVV